MDVAIEMKEFSSVKQPKTTPVSEPGNNTGATATTGGLALIAAVLGLSGIIFIRKKILNIKTSEEKEEEAKQLEEKEKKIKDLKEAISMNESNIEEISKELNFKSVVLARLNSIYEGYKQSIFIKKEVIPELNKKKKIIIAEAAESKSKIKKMFNTEINFLEKVFEATNSAYNKLKGETILISYWIIKLLNDTNNYASNELLHIEEFKDKIKKVVDSYGLTDEDIIAEKVVDEIKKEMLEDIIQSIELEEEKKDEVIKEKKNQIILELFKELDELYATV